jgi:dipeptidyl aminopeptidase/acylaminoacyl peptidase
MTEGPRRTTAAGGGDARVEAAAAHWGPRFVNNGTDYLDFERTLARIGRWEDWCAEWGRTAAEYEQIARDAGPGRTVTAMEAWRRAGLCWHWAKFVFVIDPAQLRAAHDRAVAAYAKGAAGLRPAAERVLVPYPGTDLAAYLRVPTTPDGAPPPVVVMAPGLDSVKEELQATAEYFLARGMATLAIDGPGQGESEWTLPIEPAYEKVATAAMDFLEGRADVDARRAGIYGVSLGGYYAARAMAYEPRLVAGVALAGPFRFDLEWDALPPMTRDTFKHRSRADDDVEARANAARLTLEGAAGRITSPLLVVHGARDRLVGRAHAERLAAEAPGAELRMYEDGNHGVTNHAFESRAGFADWMAERLGASGPAAGKT